MLEVSSLRLRSPPTPPSPGNSGSIKAAAAATDPPPHQLIGFVGGDHVHAAAGFPTSPAADGFMDDVDTDSLLLDYIDFSSCDVVVPFFDADGDVLPDLEADPTELLAEFSSSCPHGHQAHQGYDDDDDDDDPAAAATVVSPADDACCRPARCLIIGGDNDQAKPPSPPPDLDLDLDPDVSTTEDVVVAVAVAVEDKKATDEEKRWLLDLGAAADHNNKQKDKEGLELEPAGGGSTKATTTSNPQEEDYSAPARAGAGADASKSSSSSASAGQRYHQTHSKKKPPAASNASNNKRKVKVDWTPDLHRRFVQAVEQLGIDKAVPSRILEIMGIQGLTRHNIASHLQKYRSHRKHLMAREAEAASWAHKRQMYAAAAAGGTAAPPTMVMNHSKQQQSSAAAAAAAGPRPWVVPTIGFPPPPPAPFCRSLHVWGHPPAVSSTAAVEAPTMLLPLPAVWPRRPTWPVDPAAYWHQQYSAARKWGPPPQPAAGTPCVPPPMPMQLPRFPAVPHPVPTMYSRQPMAPPPPPPPLPPSSKPAELQLQLDAHPSKESIDAAIGDVLVKPWLPLPLGLKPPSLDSVMSELHRHGIPKVPPAAKEHC